MPTTEKTTPVPESEKPAVKSRRRTASFAELRAKKARTDVVVIPMRDEDGPYELTVKLKALSSRAYDALEAKYPPTKDQQAKGLVYNIDTFLPALISATAVEPAMTEEEVTELYESDEWSSGELGGLFFSAQKLCNGGLNADFTDAG